MRKNRKIILVSIIIVAISVYIYIIAPGTKRIFPCYEMFRITADQEAYLKRLPDSAKNVKYYVQEELFFKDKSGYRMVLSSEDYEAVKKEKLELYNNGYIQDVYLHSGDEKRPLDYEKLNCLGVDFLEELMLENASDKQYYILLELPESGSKEELYCGVICNDETYEIIEFTCYQYVAR